MVDFWTIFGAFLDPKSNQDRCQDSSSFFDRFFIQNFMVHQTPDLAKSEKNQWFVVHFGTFNMLQINVKLNQNLNPFWYPN